VGQRPDGPADDFVAWASDEAVLSWPGTDVPFDYFEGAYEPVCGIRWWGSSLSMEDFTPCERGSETFTIKFYENDSGVPGTVIAAYEDVVPTKTDTGVLYSPEGYPGRYPMYRYDLTFDTCCTLPGGAGFISIMGSGSNVDQCGTTTLSSAEGNDYMLVLREGTYRFRANDMAFCLLGEEQEAADWGVYHSFGDFSLTQFGNQWHYLAWEETEEVYVNLPPQAGPTADGDA